MQATIHELGNGLPGVDNYVPGTDGELYRIVSTNGRIHTGGYSGSSNYIHAEVELADWDDCEEDEVFPAQARVDPDEDGD